MMRNSLARYIPMGALAAILALGGCSSTSFSGGANTLSADVSAVLGTAHTDLLAANTAIAAAAPSVEVAVADAQVALGYFNTIAGTGVLPPASVKVVAKTAAVLTAIANNPPSSLASVVQVIAAAKTNIQNLSTVPAAAPATVAVVAVPATATTPAIPATTIVVPAAS